MGKTELEEGAAACSSYIDNDQNIDIDVAFSYIVLYNRARDIVKGIRVRLQILKLPNSLASYVVAASLFLWV